MIIEQGLDLALEQYIEGNNWHDWQQLPLHYIDDGNYLSRQARSPCPSGVGRYGFNSFNFLTFMVLVFNAVANVNNNINNNNNNDNDINLNSISQDSNNVVSNSDNENTVMAMILPVPGKRRRKRRTVTCPHHPRTATVILKAAKQHFFNWRRQPVHQHCEEYRICYTLKQLQFDLGLRDILIKGRPLGEDCSDLCSESEWISNL